MRLIRHEKLFSLIHRGPEKTGFMADPSEYLISLGEDKAIAELEKYSSSLRIQIEDGVLENGELCYDLNRIDEMEMALYFAQEFISLIKETRGLGPLVYTDLRYEDADLMDIPDWKEEYINRVLEESLGSKPVPDAETYFQAGRRFFQDGNYHDAVDFFKQSIRIDPSHPETYCWLGYSHGQLFRNDQKIEAYKKALEIDPDFRDAYVGLGAAYFNMNRYNEAIDSLTRAIEIDASFPPSHHAIGVAYLVLGDKDAALKEWKILKKLDKELAKQLDHEIKNVNGIKASHHLASFPNAEVCFNAGHRSYEKGEYHKAIKFFKESIRIDPSHPETYCWLGFCYRHLDHHKEEIEAYEKALEIDPDYFDAYDGLGVAYFKMNSFTEAINFFEKAIRIEPFHPDTYYRLGNSYGELNQHKEEIEAYEKSLEIDPDYFDAFVGLGTAYLDMNRFTEAINAFKRAIELDSATVMPHIGMWEIYMELGDKDAALKEFEMVRKLDIKAANELVEGIEEEERNVSGRKKDD